MAKTAMVMTPDASTRTTPQGNTSSPTQPAVYRPPSSSLHLQLLTGWEKYTWGRQDVHESCGRPDPGVIPGRPYSYQIRHLGAKRMSVLICLVTNLHKRQSDFLVVIDASTMKEISRVEFKDCQVASYYLATFYANNE